MVVEHTFVVTGDGAKAMEAGQQLLRAAGFESTAGPAFRMGGDGWQVVDMRRGKKKPEKAKNVVDLPQVIVVEFDRNLVTVGVSITPSRVWGGKRQMLSSLAQDGSEKKMKRHIAMMTSLLTGLERRMAGGESPDDALRDLREVESEALQAARKRLIRIWLIAGGVVAVIGGLVALLVVMNSNR